MLIDILDYLPVLLLAPFLALELVWLVQRPESHALHHARGIHRWNYSDLPLWDLAFGTCRNPADTGPAEAGFHDGASARLAAMLAFRKVA